MTTKKQQAKELEDGHWTWAPDKNDDDGHRRALALGLQHPPRYFVLGALRVEHIDDAPVHIDLETGEVFLADWVTPDAAAKAFWKAVTAMRNHRGIG